MKKLNSILEGISGLLLLIMTFLAVLQVFTRYVLEVPLPWVEELIRYLMIFTIFVGSGIAVYQKSHLNVDLFDQILKGRSIKYLDISRQFIITLFSSVFVVITFQFIGSLISSGQLTPAMQISMAWPMAGILIGSILMILNGGYLLYKLMFTKDITEKGGTL